MPVALRELRQVLRAPAASPATPPQLSLWVVHAGRLTPWSRKMCSAPDCLRPRARFGELCEAHKKRRQLGKPLSPPVATNNVPVSALERLHDAAISRADAVAAGVGVVAADDCLRKAADAFAEQAEGLTPAQAGTLDALRDAATRYAEADGDADYTRADRWLQRVALAYGRGERNPSPPRATVQD